MKRNLFLIGLVVVWVLSLGNISSADVPTMINYHGYLQDDSGAFTGTAYLKLAIVDSQGTNYWTNDGSNLVTPDDMLEPTNSVSVTVTDGVFNVLLGDDSLTNMVELNEELFSGSSELYLRVFVSTDDSTFEQLSPDKQLVAVGYAMQSYNADYVGGLDPDDLVDESSTQTLTDKTLSEVTITETATASGATWTNLGTVETVDIDGGTIDDVNRITVDDISLDGNAITADGDEIELYADIKTDRWLERDSNTLIGIDVAGADNLSHSSSYDGYYNTFIGNKAGYNCTTGYSNIALGYKALYDNETGIENIAIGDDALNDNVDGENNIAIGKHALYSTTKNFSIGLGEYAAAANETGLANIAIGSGAMQSTEGGSYNVAIGYDAGNGNSSATVDTGSWNCFLGSFSGEAIEDGFGNVLIGLRAGNTITSGDYNIIIGYDQDTPAADTSNFLNIGGVIYGDLDNDYVGIGVISPNEQLELTGNLRLPAATADAGIVYKDGNTFLHDYGTNNTFLGIGAGNLTLTGSENIAIGDQALTSDTSGGGNLAIGYQTLTSNTTGANNIALGEQALYTATTVSNNIAIGKQVLYSNTSGHSNQGLGNATLYSNTTGCYNVAIGQYSMYDNTIGERNCTLGYHSMQNNTEGDYNVALGYIALQDNTTGSSNIGIGCYAGGTNETGTGLTLIGSNADVASDGLDNAAAIGYNAEVGASDSLILGGTGDDAVSVGIGTTTPDRTFEIEMSSTGDVSTVDVEIGQGVTDPDVTFIKLRSPDGSEWYVFPNNAGTLVCTTTEP